MYADFHAPCTGSGPAFGTSITEPAPGGGRSAGRRVPTSARTKPRPRRRQSGGLHRTDGPGGGRPAGDATGWATPPSRVCGGGGVACAGATEDPPGVASGGSGPCTCTPCSEWAGHLYLCLTGPVVKCCAQ
eukprot:scaffold3586_cov404-Prasinococcus_capsulatus_cf.AAC.32